MEPTHLQEKLEEIANVDKSRQWIEGYLVIEPSSWLGRFFFPLINIFESLRNFFYNINHQSSSTRLSELRAKVIAKQPHLAKIYNAAADKFNSISRKYKVEKLELTTDQKILANALKALNTLTDYQWEVTPATEEKELGFSVTGYIPSSKFDVHLTEKLEKAIGNSSQILLATTRETYKDVYYAQFYPTGDQIEQFAALGRP